MAPLWLTIATGPSSGGDSRNMVEKFAMAPVPKLARPWVLGPTMRMPWARAVATIACSTARPAAPVSPKPEAITTATLTPRSAQAATAATAAWPGTATTASSGASGRLARSG
jgi:hypothetical protein